MQVLFIRPLQKKKRASQDRLLACQIAGVPPPPSTAFQVATTAGATELASFLRYASANSPTTEISPGDNPVAPSSACHTVVERGEESSSRAHRTSNKESSSGITISNKIMVCAACYETKHSFDILHAICGHDYCRGCITSLFNLSITDESVFPPRCCQQETSVDLAREILSPESRTRFLK